MAQNTDKTDASGHQDADAAKEKVAERKGPIVAPTPEVAKESDADKSPR